MKQILILVNTYKDSYNALIEAGEFAQAKVTVKTFSDVMVYASSTNRSIAIDGIPLETFDLVYLRALIRQPELAAVLNEACKELSIPIVDPVFSRSLVAEGKITSYWQLASQQLPIIPSMYVSEKNLDALNFEYPLIVKLSDSSQGRDVHLCHTIEETRAVFDQYRTHLIVQPFIPNDGDLRVLVVDRTVIGSIKRMAQGDEHRNNVSLGGKTEVYAVTPEIEQLAIAATTALKYLIAGVDLVRNGTTGDWSIIEVNRAPQYEGFMNATGINVPEKIVAALVGYVHE